MTESDSAPCNPADGADNHGMKTAPLDIDANAAYMRALKIAEDAGLVISAYGGVAVIATPAEQRKSGDRARTLMAHGIAEHPDNPPLLKGDAVPASTGDLFGDAAPEPE